MTYGCLQTARCQASAPALVGRVNQQGHGGSDWMLDRSGWRASMLEHMEGSSVSRGRCYDNAAAKVEKFYGDGYSCS